MKGNAKMKCPYCGKEMDKGFFYSSKWDYTWTPEGKKPHYWRNFPKEYEVVLKKGAELQQCLRQMKEEQIYLSSKSKEVLAFWLD